MARSRSVRNKSDVMKRQFRSFAGMQKYFFVVAGFNAFYNWTPFFLLKRWILRLFGIHTGSNTYIHTKVKFFRTGNLVIGSHTTINGGCYLDNRANITIGNNVSIAHDTKIYTMGHDIDDPDFRTKSREVVIEDYVCVFSGVLIMPGVTIGKGAVVLPGAVVSKDVRPFSVVGGNPAAFIRERSRDLRYTIDYGYWFAL